MGEDNFKIDPSIDPRLQAGLDWLLNEGGVPPEEIDGSASNLSDGTLTDEEFVHFVYDHPNWERYLPALDWAGLRHPLDPRNLPALTLPTIYPSFHDPQKETEETLPIIPGDLTYWSTLVPILYEEGGLHTFDQCGFVLFTWLTGTEHFNY